MDNNNTETKKKTVEEIAEEFNNGPGRKENTHKPAPGGSVPAAEEVKIEAPERPQPMAGCEMPTTEELVEAGGLEDLKMETSEDVKDPLNCELKEKNVVKLIDEEHTGYTALKDCLGEIEAIDEVKRTFIVRFQISHDNNVVLTNLKREQLRFIADHFIGETVPGDDSAKVAMPRNVKEITVVVDGRIMDMDTLARTLTDFIKTKHDAFNGPNSGPIALPGDVVGAPPWYIGNNGIELKDVIYGFGLDHYAYRAKALKYILRAHNKNDFALGDVQDLEKAIECLQIDIDYIKAKGNGHE
ncbi:MAG: DUF3310 domain-containing protein [Candidatus Peribacteraceae bacterium]|nr:DUF3310 domain-containing protein [Candidatus Peribacteraceae bacterium]